MVGKVEPQVVAISDREKKFPVKLRANHEQMMEEIKSGEAYEALVEDMLTAATTSKKSPLKDARGKSYDWIYAVHMSDQSKLFNDPITRSKRYEVASMLIPGIGTGICVNPEAKEGGVIACWSPDILSSVKSDSEMSFSRDVGAESFAGRRFSEQGIVRDPVTEPHKGIRKQKGYKGFDIIPIEWLGDEKSGEGIFNEDSLTIDNMPGVDGPVDARGKMLMSRSPYRDSHGTVFLTSKIISHDGKIGDFVFNTPPPELPKGSEFTLPEIELIRLGEEDELDVVVVDEALIKARDKKMPIVIQKGNEFLVYGDTNGSGSWDFNLMDDSTDLFDLNQLPFEDNKIERSHPLFTELLSRIKKEELHVFPTTIGKLSQMKENMFDSVRGTGFFIPFDIVEKKAESPPKDGTIIYSTYKGRDKEYYQYSVVLPGGDEIKEVKSKVAVGTNPNEQNKYKIIMENDRFITADDEAAHAIKAVIEIDMIESHLIANYLKTKAKLRTAQEQYRHRKKQAEELRSKRNFLTVHSISAGEEYKRDNAGLLRFLKHEHRPDSEVEINEAFVATPAKENVLENWRQRNSLPADQHTIKTPYLNNQRIENEIDADHFRKLLGFGLTNACDKAKLRIVMKAIKAQMELFRDYGIIKPLLVVNHDFDMGTIDEVPADVMRFLYALYYLLDKLSDDQLEQNFYDMFSEEFAKDRYNSLASSENLAAVADKILTVNNLRRAIREYDFIAIKYLLTYLPSSKINLLGKLETEKLRLLLEGNNKKDILPLLEPFSGNIEIDLYHKKLFDSFDKILNSKLYKKEQKLKKINDLLQKAGISIEELLLDLSPSVSSVDYARVNALKRLAFYLHPPQLALIASIDSRLGQKNQWLYLDDQAADRAKIPMIGREDIFIYHPTIPFPAAHPDCYTSIVKLAVAQNKWENILEIASNKGSNPDNADLDFAMLRAALQALEAAENVIQLMKMADDKSVQPHAQETARQSADAQRQIAHTKWSQVEALLDYGVNGFDLENEKGEKLIHLVIRGNKLSLLKKMFAMKADINAQTRFGVFALKLAEQLGHDDIVDFLKKRLAVDMDVRTLDRTQALELARKTPTADGLGAHLLEATKVGDFSSVKKFLAHGVKDIDYVIADASESNGYSVIHSLCAANQADIVSDLINRYGFGPSILLTSHIVDGSSCFTPIEIVAKMHLEPGKMQGNLNEIISIIGNQYPKLIYDIVEKNQLRVLEQLFSILGVHYVLSAKSNVNGKPQLHLLELVDKLNTEEGPMKGKLGDMMCYIRSHIPKQEHTTLKIASLLRSANSSHSNLNLANQESKESKEEAVLVPNDTADDLPPPYVELADRSFETNASPEQASIEEKEMSESHCTAADWGDDVRDLPPVPVASAPSDLYLYQENLARIGASSLSGMHGTEQHRRAAVSTGLKSTLEIHRGNGNNRRNNECSIS